MNKTQSNSILNYLICQVKRTLKGCSQRKAVYFISEGGGRIFRDETLPNNIGMHESVFFLSFSGQ